MKWTTQHPNWTLALTLLLALYLLYQYVVFRVAFIGAMVLYVPALVWWTSILVPIALAIAGIWWRVRG